MLATIGAWTTPQNTNRDWPVETNVKNTILPPTVSALWRSPRRQAVTLASAAKMRSIIKLS